MAAVPDDVPVRRMDPDEVVPAGKVLAEQIEPFSEVPTPIINPQITVLVESVYDVPGRTRAHHRVRHAPGSVAEHQILEQPPVTVAAVGIVSPERTPLRVRDDGCHSGVVGVQGLRVRLLLERLRLSGQSVQKWCWYISVIHISSSVVAGGNAPPAWLSC